MIEGPLYYSWIAARHSGSFCFFLGGGRGKGELECAKVVVEREAFKFSWAFKIKDGGYSRKIHNARRSFALTINSPAVRAREVVLINIFWP